MGLAYGEEPLELELIARGIVFTVFSHHYVQARAQGRARDQGCPLVSISGREDITNIYSRGYIPLQTMFMIMYEYKGEMVKIRHPNICKTIDWNERARSLYCRSKIIPLIDAKNDG